MEGRDITDTKPKERLLSTTCLPLLPPAPDPPNPNPTHPLPLVEERGLRVTGLTFRRARVLVYTCPCQRPLKIWLDTVVGGGGQAGV